MSTGLETDPAFPFGRVLVAMVTPFDAAGALDVDGAQRLASYLVDDAGCDGLVLSGTTGESPTTSDEEKQRLLSAVLEAVGDRATILAGVGTNDTAHTVHLAQQAAQAGCDGLLVVTPYYSRPPQSALVAHFRAVADATELPLMLYDIPVRTGVPLAPATLATLAEHPRIVAVKDAKGDLGEMSWTMARTGLAYYCGDDMLNLPMIAVGAVGVVSVVGHVVAPRLREMLDAHDKGDTAHALAVHRGLLPVYSGMFRTQGVILTKAALGLLGLPGGPVRAPLLDATEAELDTLAEDLQAGGVAW
ncbi:MAG: 4-hydroxy-tetrahydrodipicolinate synthase [Geodermatophilaceae bacterium]|nr:4-hydroxy-tetrahydrodipicolinate synthase [Geodermatophilaceae bacterium]MDQ3454589.1 4-hydroxy-tetrahydrodipicolinate synthase [Actinomycetota bacterium]